MVSASRRSSPIVIGLLIALVAVVAVIWLLSRLREPTEPGEPGGAPSAASVTGRVFLEGRARHNGVYVTLDRGDSGFDETTADGVFVINNIILGWHILRLDMPRYLAVEGRFLAGQNVTVLGDLTMVAGDAYGDNVIDILDLALVARQYGTEPPGDPRADINDNGIVDIFDLVLVSKNYDRTGPTDGQNPQMTVIPSTLSGVFRDKPVETKRDADRNDPTATWTLIPNLATYSVGEVVRVQLSLENAANVYGVDVRQPYNARQLRPRDLEPGTPQVDMRLGALFSGGFAPINRAEGGALRLAVTQVGQATRPPSGVVFETNIEVIGCGETVFDARRGIRLTDGKAGVIPVNAGPPATLRTPCP